MRRFRPLRDLARDESGMVAPMIAVLGVSLLAAAGVALDVGLYYSGDRDLRAATEAAALAAAMNPAQAQARAQSYLSKNGYDASVLRSVEVGYYCANKDSLASSNSGSRFFAAAARPADCTGSSLGIPNAVRLTTGKASRQFLSGVLGGASPIPELGATASSARVDEAGVATTSDVLSLTTGRITDTLVRSVNSLLGALIGLQLNLSGPDIDSLMRHDVDAGKFFDALARRTNKTGSYYQLTQGTYSLKDIAFAAAEATSDASTATVLKTIGGVGSGYMVPMSGLFGLGVWKNMPVGGSDVKPALRAGLNAYQLIAFAAQAGPGAIDLSDAVSLVVPGSTVRLAGVYNGPRARPRFAFGPAGNETEIGNSALRLQLELGLGTINLPLLGTAINVNSVPVLVDVAAAEAKITNINCDGSSEQGRDTRVTVQASSGLVNAYIGTAPANVLTKAIVSPTDIQQANLVNVLGLITIDARAEAGPVFGKSGSLVFGPGGQGTIGSPTTPGKSAHMANGSQLGPLLTSLPNSLVAQNGLKIKLLGLCVWPLCDANAREAQVTQQVVGALTTPISGLVGNTVDPLLDTVLAALGIQLGDTTVWVTGARCGVPVLI
ncbi:TadG family pilus assembly protein [Novosphingobium sp. BL-52-GroH]|uniref:TadG family pilus assembly protein n=1 Tax=Novosphingobium sp. BL-52-GroH TaxID=3349877 RepID=UPI00384C638F